MTRIVTLILLLFSLLITSCSGSNVDEEGPPVPDLDAWLDANPTVKASIKLENIEDVTYFWGGSLSETPYEILA